MDMEKKSLIIGGIIGSIVGLFLLVTAIALPSVSASNNCVDIEYLNQKLERIYEKGVAPSYLDCITI